MMGECVIVFDDSLKSEARFIRKQSAQLASKMRYLSCQFTAYLTDELWLKNATHANAMAKRLADALEQVPGVHFTQRVESNQLFLTMPRAETDRMLQTYFFYFWNEEADEIRLVTSFDTTEEDIDTFIRILEKIVLYPIGADAHHRVTQSLTEGKIIGIKTLWDSVLLRGEQSFLFLTYLRFFQEQFDIIHREVLVQQFAVPIQQYVTGNAIEME